MTTLLIILVVLMCVFIFFKVLSNMYEAYLTFKLLSDVCKDIFKDSIKKEEERSTYEGLN